MTHQSHKAAYFKKCKKERYDKILKSLVLYFVTLFDTDYAQTAQFYSLYYGHRQLAYAKNDETGLIDFVHQLRALKQGVQLGVQLEQRRKKDGTYDKNISFTIFC